MLTPGPYSNFNAAPGNPTDYFIIQLSANLTFRLVLWLVHRPFHDDRLSGILGTNVPIHRERVSTRQRLLS
jgi:hypothetical protein